MTAPADQTGPIARANATLLAQLAKAGAPVDLCPPSDPQETLRLNVWPVAFQPETFPASPLQMRVRYLVVAVGPHRDVLALWDRLLQTEQPFLVPEEVPARLWQQLGARPGLGLFFEVPVQFSRPQTASPRVTAPPRLVPVRLREVSGRVLTPGGVPLSGMRVSAADGTSSAHTDTKGRFVLPGVNAEQPARLTIEGRGLRLSADVAAADAEPVVITCEI